MNKVWLFGRPTKDPELRYTPSNIASCTFTLAVQREYKNADGKYDCDFIPIVIWRQAAEYAAKYLKKGKRVSLSGRIQTRNYKTQDGSTRYVTEVIAETVKCIDYEAETAEAAYEAPAGFAEVDDNDIPI